MLEAYQLFEGENKMLITAQVLMAEWKNSHLEQGAQSMAHPPPAAAAAAPWETHWQCKSLGLTPDTAGSETLSAAPQSVLRSPPGESDVRALK